MQRQAPRVKSTLKDLDVVVAGTVRVLAKRRGLRRLDDGAFHGVKARRNALEILLTKDGVLQCGVDRVGAAVRPAPLAEVPEGPLCPDKGPTPGCAVGRLLVPAPELRRCAPTALLSARGPRAGRGAPCGA